MDICALCHSTKRDDVKYGEFLNKGNISVHLFCLYLTSNLAQNGHDHQGFYGFMIKDIHKETKRISKLKCIYCKGYYANIGCCASRCLNTFHTICGIENNAENQFRGTYRSFCHLHHTDKAKVDVDPNETCCICYDQLMQPGEKFNNITMLRAPCCRNGWFHKYCLQRFAFSSGYFFKCPLCNNTEEFHNKLCERGIFVPNRDAAWELEPNAFAELQERPSSCAAPNCHNRRGRSDTEHSPLLFCITCGSQAIHQSCLVQNTVGHKRRLPNSFQCEECSGLLNNDSGNQSICQEEEDSSDDEEIDICALSSSNESESDDTLPKPSGSLKRRLPSSSSSDDSRSDVPLISLVARVNPSRRRRILSEATRNSSDSSHRGTYLTRSNKTRGTASEAASSSSEYVIRRGRALRSGRPRVIIDDTSDSDSDSEGSYALKEHNLRKLNDMILDKAKRQRRGRLIADTSETSSDENDNQPSTSKSITYRGSFNTGNKCRAGNESESDTCYSNRRHSTKPESDKVQVLMGSSSEDDIKPKRPCMKYVSSEESDSDESTKWTGTSNSNKEGPNSRFLTEDRAMNTTSRRQKVSPTKCKEFLEISYESTDSDSDDPLESFNIIIKKKHPELSLNCEQGRVHKNEKSDVTKCDMQASQQSSIESGRSSELLNRRKRLSNKGPSDSKASSSAKRAKRQSMLSASETASSNESSEAEELEIIEPSTSRRTRLRSVNIAKKEENKENPKRLRPRNTESAQAEQAIIIEANTSENCIALRTRLRSVNLSREDKPNVASSARPPLREAKVNSVSINSRPSLRDQRLQPRATKSLEAEQPNVIEASTSENCIARRTRLRSINLTREEEPKIESARRPLREAKVNVSRINFGVALRDPRLQPRATKDLEAEQPQAIETSTSENCIARRTRLRSLHLPREEEAEEAKVNDPSIRIGPAVNNPRLQPRTTENGSCIANRTRSKSMCVERENFLKLEDDDKLPLKKPNREMSGNANRTTQSLGNTSGGSVVRLRKCKVKLKALTAPKEDRIAHPVGSETYWRIRQRLTLGLTNKFSSPRLDFRRGKSITEYSSPFETVTSYDPYVSSMLPRRIGMDL